MKIDALFESEHLPVMISPGADKRLSALHEYLRSEAEPLRALLGRHGGILFRGFEVEGAEDFRATNESLGAQPFDYVGGNSPRSRVAADVFTSTEYPASEVISLHNEMSYLPSWPRRLFFCSVVPAASGGQTSLAHGGEVLRRLPADVVQRLRSKQISYIRNFRSDIPLGKNWQTTYQTDDRAEVEAIAASQGSTCRWQPNGSLRVSTRCQATLVHPDTGAEYWFNQAEQWHPTALNPAIRSMFEGMVGRGNLPHECEYGDGEPMEPEVLAEIRRVLDDSKLLFDWQRGDVLMIDNVAMMHGREAFKGERKTLAYLSST